MKTPVAIYVIHHPECTVAADLAKSLYDWFRLGYLSGDQSGAGLPVYYRRMLEEGVLQPTIRFEEATLNVVVVLVDENVGRAQELGFWPLFVAGEALGEIAGAREEQRRPAAAARARTGKAIHGRRAGELLVRAMHAEAVQTA